MFATSSILDHFTQLSASGAMILLLTVHLSMQPLVQPSVLIHAGVGFPSNSHNILSKQLAAILPNHHKHDKRKQPFID